MLKSDGRMSNSPRHSNGSSGFVPDSWYTTIARPPRAVYTRSAALRMRALSLGVTIVTGALPNRLVEFKRDRKRPD